MVNFTKLIDLSANGNTKVNDSPKRGSIDNPYTQDEHDAFTPGTWPGGYVEGVGFVVPNRPKTALESSYPDDGNVLYPGIFVEGGRFQADHEEFFGISDNTINVWWDSGFTGNFNTHDDPDWFHSNISAYADMHAPGSKGLVTANWAKVSDGVYKAEVHHRLSEKGSSLEMKEYTMEELLSGHKP